MDTLLQDLHNYTDSLAQKPLFGLLLTLLVYQGALWLYNRCNRSALIHPVAVSAVVIALLLKISGISYQDYVDANQLIYFLLGPTTVALAIPLYNEFHVLRRQAMPILVTVLFGALAAPAIAVGIAWGMGASDEVLLSLAPKSVTTPIAIGIADQIGAMATLTTGVVVFTGILGVLLSPAVFWLSRLGDTRLQGVVMGINAHGVGTARCFEIGSDSGAFATMAMGLTGTFTALTLPYLIHWLGY
ncbi:LrgB family protein [Pseudomaricurvus sp. HS19]|uniref:LrgB family protein n=1 Tax=Pseudomaricurvus sp. HS19 TaxID=2692626 RepID=UPI00136A6458|nr:LrgB family protein [Pseudomaricurvus sp. HS19]MYM63698.1 LrgB family protein [Pseudomaricurvus sp. HS19]